MKLKYTLLFGLCVPEMLLANTMSQSFKDGQNVGKSNNSNAQDVLKTFSPNTALPNFNANPPETQYHVGIGGTESVMNAKGMQVFTDSESGKAIQSSTINNPKVNMSLESDFLQNSAKIQQNADVISGMKAGGQCVAKVLNKTTFSSHYCEKDNQVQQTCTVTSKVNWVKKVRTEIKEIVINNNMLTKTNSETRAGLFRRIYYGHFKFKAPENGVLIGWTIKLKNTGNVNISVFNFFDDNKSVLSGSELHYTSDKKHIEVKTGDELSGYVRGTGRWRSGVNYDLTIKLQFYANVEVEEPELVEESKCNVDADNAIKMNDSCTQGAATRKFERNGKTYELHSECWEKTANYLVSDASDDECRAYDSNKSCTISERECIAQNGEYCSRFRVKYQCSKTTSTNGVVCGDQFFCNDGSCSDLDNSVNTDFGHSVSQLASLFQAGKDIGLNEQSLRAFTGRSMQCRKSGFGFSDCCKDSGWGNKAGLAQCNSEENTLGKAKEKKLTIFVGTYCSKKVLGKCIQRKSSYCVFDSKLARIVQYQGRSGQLRVGFGDSKNPDCRGISIDEIQAINFDTMDYSDFYEDLENGTQFPNQNEMMDYIKSSISEQMR